MQEHDIADKDDIAIESHKIVRQTHDSFQSRRDMMMISFIMVPLFAAKFISSFSVQGTLSTINDDTVSINLHANKLNISNDVNELMEKLQATKRIHLRINLEGMVIDIQRQMLEINNGIDRKKDDLVMKSNKMATSTNIAASNMQMKSMKQQYSSNSKKIIHQDLFHHKNSRNFAISQENFINLDQEFDYFVLPQNLSDTEVVSEGGSDSKNELKIFFEYAKSIQNILLLFSKLLNIQWRQSTNDVLSENSLRSKFFRLQKQMEFLLEKLVQENRRQFQEIKKKRLLDDEIVSRFDLRDSYQDFSRDGSRSVILNIEEEQKQFEEIENKKIIDDLDASMMRLQISYKDFLKNKNRSICGISNTAEIQLEKITTLNEEMEEEKKKNNKRIINNQISLKSKSQISYQNTLEDINISVLNTEEDIKFNKEMKLNEENKQIIDKDDKAISIKGEIKSNFGGNYNKIPIKSEKITDDPIASKAQMRILKDFKLTDINNHDSKKKDFTTVNIINEKLMKNKSTIIDDSLNVNEKSSSQIKNMEDKNSIAIKDDVSQGIFSKKKKFTRTFDGDSFAPSRFKDRAKNISAILSNENVTSKTADTKGVKTNIVLDASLRRNVTKTPRVFSRRTFQILLPWSKHENEKIQHHQSKNKIVKQHNVSDTMEGTKTRIDRTSMMDEILDVVNEVLPMKQMMKISPK